MIDPTLVGLGVVGVVAVALFVVACRPLRKLPEEKGLVPLFTARCAGTTRAGFGFQAGTNMPTCRLTLYDNAMVVAVGAPVLIAYGDVEHVECKRSWLTKAVVVTTRNPKMVASFSVRSPEQVASILRAKGVHVVGS